MEKKDKGTTAKIDDPEARPMPAEVRKAIGANLGHWKRDTLGTAKEQYVPYEGVEIPSPMNKTKNGKARNR